MGIPQLTEMGSFPVGYGNMGSSQKSDDSGESDSAVFGSPEMVAREPGAGRLRCHLK